MSEPRQWQLCVNGLNYAAQSWGPDDGLPVLALHGWLDNSASFARLAPQLRGVHLLALDMAGQGRSQHRPGAGSYNFWDDVQDVLGLLTQLGWPQPLLLGHSRGAIIAALTAATFPERIAGLALIEGLMPEPADPAQVPQQLQQALLALQAAQHKTRTLYPDMHSAVRARARGMFPLSEGAARLLALRGVEPVVSDEGVAGFSWTSDPRLQAPSAVRLTSEQIAALLARLTMPSKLLLARDGLPKLYPQYLQRLQQFPHLSYQLLDGGHHLHMESQYEQVADQLNPFFASLGAQVDSMPFRGENPV